MAITFLIPHLLPTMLSGRNPPNYHSKPAFHLRRHEWAVKMPTRRVLVVEDDLIQRRQLVRALEEFGYRLFHASNGLEAVRTLDSQEIHLVLTDIRMPFVDGISLLKYIKTFFPHVPVVVATAYPGDVGDIKPDALLCKPFGPERLTDLIKSLIQYPKGR